jgi:hypothetical protein
MKVNAPNSKMFGRRKSLRRAEIAVGKGRESGARSWGGNSGPQIFANEK